MFNFKVFMVEPSKKGRKIHLLGKDSNFQFFKSVFAITSSKSLSFGSRFIHIPVFYSGVKFEITIPNNSSKCSRKVAKQLSKVL